MNATLPATNSPILTSSQGLHGGRTGLYYTQAGLEIARYCGPNWRMKIYTPVTWLFLTCRASKDMFKLRVLLSVHLAPANLLFEKQTAQCLENIFTVSLPITSMLMSAAFMSSLHLQQWKKERKKRQARMSSVLVHRLLVHLLQGSFFFPLNTSFIFLYPRFGCSFFDFTIALWF